MLRARSGVRGSSYWRAIRGTGGGDPGTWCAGCGGGVGLASSVYEQVQVSTVVGCLRRAERRTTIAGSISTFINGEAMPGVAIGSAAGVVAMGMEKIDFMWYIKKIAFLAFIGYISGFITFILLRDFVLI